MLVSKYYYEINIANDEKSCSAINMQIPIHVFYRFKKYFKKLMTEN